MVMVFTACKEKRGRGCMHCQWDTLASTDKNILVSQTVGAMPNYIDKQRKANVGYCSNENFE